MTRLIFLFAIVMGWAGLIAAPARQLGQAVQFNNFPLDESLILYIDDEGYLALESINTGAVARLTSEAVAAEYGVAYSVSPTRQTILYNDTAGGAYLISLEFFADGRLLVTPPAGPLPVAPRSVSIDWSPDGTKLAYLSNNSQPVAITARGEALPLPVGVLDFGGWSYDSRWLAYCDSNDQLGVVDQTGASQVVAGGVDCPPSLGMNMAWSPAAPQLAYGVGDSTEGFMTLYVHDLATGTTYPLPQTGELLGWSPSGRALAIGVGRVGAALHIPSVTVVDPHGQRAQTLPEITTATVGVIGWLDRPTSMPIFGNYFVAEDLGFTERISDAVFDASADGRSILWGSALSGSLDVICGDSRSSGQPVYYAARTTLPDPNWSHSSELRPYPAVHAILSPNGQNALAQAYVPTGEDLGDWERLLVSCVNGAPLMRQVGGDQGLSSDYRFSADSRLLFLVSPLGSSSAPQIFEIAGDGVVLRRTYPGHSSAFEWLVTPEAAPPISQAGNSVSPLEPVTPTAPPAHTGQFAFVDGGNIWLINADGSGRQPITSSGVDCCPAWSPDGNQLYFVRNPGTDNRQTDTRGLVFVYDFAIGQERSIDVPGVSVSNDLAVSPDGRRLLFGDSDWTEDEHFGRVHKGCLHLFDMDSGEDIVLDCTAPGSIRSVAFSPVEPAFVAEIGSFDISTLTFFPSTSSPPQIDHEVCCGDLDFDADGVAMVTVESSYTILGGQLNYYERNGEEPTILLITNDYLREPDISPEGDRLLYAIGETIEIMSLPSRARTPVVAGDDPAWRPGQATAINTLDTETADVTPVDINPTPPVARSRRSGSGATGVVVVLMALGLFAWGVYMTQRK